MKKKHPITIVLTEETWTTLYNMAIEQSRPVAQLARVILEREIVRILNISKMLGKKEKDNG